MQRERVTRRSQAALVVGWVSNTDAIFMGLILTLTVTMLVAARLRQSEGKNRRMGDSVVGLQGQLDQAQSRMAELETERERLKQDNRKLDATTSQLGPLRSERDKLSSALAKAVEERRRLAAESEALKTRLAAAQSYIAEMKSRLEQTNAEKREATVQLATATEERDAIQREARVMRSRIEAEPGLHKELIGLKGNLQRVAIVFDTSGSMAESGRWDQARGVVAAWLDHLAIGECVLVLFSSDAQVFPEDGSFLDMRGPAGAANRRLLLDRIRAVKPEGGTNTLLAMQVAYRCARLDTVILFTDGEPNDPHGPITNQFDPAVAEKIYVLCAEHKHIPVNTIGLGNYFKPQLSGFLMRVAQDTGGNFLGR